MASGLAVADGTVLSSGDAGWDDARLAWNLAADQHPETIVVAASAEDVAATVRHAAEHGLRVAPQTTGHSATELDGFDDTILLRTGSLDTLEVDAGARRARIGGGVLALTAAEATGAHGLTPLLGSAVDVGVAGFSIGGGLGWLARSQGLACNAIRSAQLVTGEGEILRVDAESDADLFWAIRGGGGAFGVVTELELDLFETGELLAGDVMFDIEHAPDVFGTYLEWAGSAPPEVTSSIRLLTPPPVPDVPEPMRGRPLVTITAAVTGDAGAAEEILAPLRGAAPALMDAFAPMGPEGLCRIHGDPEQPVPGFTTGCLVDALDEATAQRVVDAFTGSSLLQVDFRQLGGAVGEPAEGGGVLSHLPGALAMSAVGALMAPGAAEVVPGDLAAVSEVLAPVRGEGRYMNFDDEPGDGSSLFGAESYARLRAVKGRVDPQNVVRGGKDIPPA